MTPTWVTHYNNHWLAVTHNNWLWSKNFPWFSYWTLYFLFITIQPKLLFFFFCFIPTISPSVSQYTNAFAMTQLCGVLCAPWNGLIMDRHKGKPLAPGKSTTVLTACVCVCVCVCVYNRVEIESQHTVKLQIFCLTGLQATFGSTRSFSGKVRQWANIFSKCEW